MRSPNIKSTLQDDITGLFKEAKQDVTHPLLQERIKNYVAIGNFLMDEENVFSCLLELEIAINEKLKSNYIDIENDKLNNDYTKGSIKVLRNYLVQYLVNLGFSKETVVPVDILSEDEFYNITKNKYLLKDSVFRGKSHGEFSHLLQWYFISRAVEKGLIQLTQSLVDIYSEIGRKLCDRENGEPQSVWDMLVDIMAKNNIENFKFRSPEYIVQYFMDNTQDKISTLQFLLGYRLSSEYMEKHSLEEDMEEESSEEGNDSKQPKAKTYQSKLKEKYDDVSNQRSFKYYINKNISSNVLIFNSEFDEFKKNIQVTTSSKQKKNM